MQKLSHLQYLVCSNMWGTLHEKKLVQNQNFIVNCALQKKHQQNPQRNLEKEDTLIFVAICICLLVDVLSQSEIFEVILNDEKMALLVTLRIKCGRMLLFHRI